MRSRIKQDLTTSQRSNVKPEAKIDSRGDVVDQMEEVEKKNPPNASQSWWMNMASVVILGAKTDELTTVHVYKMYSLYNALISISYCLLFERKLDTYLIASVGTSMGIYVVLNIMEDNRKDLGSSINLLTLVLAIGFYVLLTY